MAGKKTDETPGTTEDVHEATATDDAVAVSAPETPDTVDAEIVDETRRDEPQDAEAVTTEPITGVGGDDGRDPPADDVVTKKKGGGGGFVLGLLIVLIAIAIAAYFFRDDLGLTGPSEVETAEDAPGVVVTEGVADSEIRRPVVARAAPGTREAARRADQAENAPSETAEESVDEAEATTEPAVAAASAAADTVADTTTSALRQRAAERARQRREEREAAQAAQADEAAQDEEAGDLAAAEEATQTDATLGFVTQDDQSEMAEAVRRARAEQERIRREDLERARQLRADRTAPAPTEDDDPNVLPAFTAPDAEDTSEAATATPQDDTETPDGSEDRAAAAEALRQRLAGQDATEDADTATPPQTQPTRPTGRVRPVDDETGEAAEPVPSETANRPQPVQPRPPVLSDGSRTQGNVATQEQIDQRIEAVEADLRSALRQDLSAEVRQDVLAEASQRIDQAIRQTEQQVAQLRTALTEQEARSDQRIAQLQDRLEVLQSRDATENTRGVLILALSNLRGELDAGRPFERQLDDVEYLAPNVQSLEGARRFASTGLPTDADLRLAFRDAARNAATQEARANSEGFFGQMWANVKGLFSVREIGPVEGDTTSAIISRAETALTDGDVAEAVEELQALEGPAADAFANFLADARATAETRTQIERLERAVLDSDQ